MHSKVAMPSKPPAEFNCSDDHQVAHFHFRAQQQTFIIAVADSIILLEVTVSGNVHLLA